ncbi:MAG: DUF1343 domain-containing protein [Blastocatellia bacterium]|nr:DUF1343 domain-containing protein [Blastocatellia bacterium]MCS7157341.1 DUF1343 domain-containing protein [Blastocatellia bacterium]MCX7753207.1 DUF1343 domain-containing protein [Blastocatellia bacterium]MDW8168245.1 DUF1343 domain-containing protein [Acidobacteriota bacterium]MDW8255461.1 DUF1343 domain-containing protein [Acidobacteriota bacterium]
MHLGLDVLLSRHRHLLRGKRIGLIVHPPSLDRHRRHAIERFATASDVRLTAIFGPQHGLRGETQDNMIEWEGWRDPKLGIPIFSLYGATRIPTPEMLADVDVLVLDLQDVGTRVYTYIWTMALCMMAAAREGREMIVLDRPNPIGGVHVEGPVLQQGFESFVGMFPIPLRHGMTIGELARLFNEAFGIGCRLHVIPMQGWRRDLWYDQTDLLWVLPSPNMPTLETATVYPGMVLFEGTLLSEGRGTTRPFELIGAPFIDPDRLVAELRAEKLPGVFFRPCYFQPTFHKYAEQLCGGVQVHVLDRERFKPVLTAVALLKAIHRLYPEHFQWRQPPYEYVFDRLPFDILAGTDRLRQQIAEDRPLREIEDSWRADLESFRKLRRDHLMY